MSTPPKKPKELLSLGEVPKYLRCKHYTEISRATVYNWTIVGKKGVKLRTIKVRHGVDTVIKTSKEWVDEFVTATAQWGKQ